MKLYVKVFLGKEMIGMFDIDNTWTEPMIIEHVDRRYGKDVWDNFEVIKGD